MDRPLFTMKTGSPIRWLWFFGAALPSILPLAMILIYGVNFPYWDEWDRSIAGMYIKAHQHQLTFGDLVRQHNEHRILIPRLIFLALNSMTHWNAIGEMIAQWVVVVLTSLLILALCRRTESPKGLQRIFGPEPIRGR